MDSLIYVKNGKLILDASSKINIINLNEVYKFLLTPKKLRTKINKISFNSKLLFKCFLTLLEIENNYEKIYYFNYGCNAINKLFKQSTKQL